MTYCVIITTCESEVAAKAIAEHLVAQHLAACVQLIPIQSVYRWQGEVCREPEVQLLIKTRTELFEAVEAAIQTLHSYEVPEIIALPILQGSGSYLDWLQAETQSFGE